MKILNLLAVLFFCLFYGRVHAQTPALSPKDAGEITYRSELLINQFRDLLNIISNSQTDIKETKDLIYNSYSGNRNRIFFDSTVLVEDDLSPLVTNSDKSKDVPICNYLNNLDLFYTKTDAPTIEIITTKVSNIKRGDYLYVKVYYNTEFRGKSSLSDSVFHKTNRVAEIRLEKQANKWTGAIMHIGFVNDVAAVSDTTNDLKLAYADREKSDGPSLTVDKGVSDSFEESLKEKERQKQIEEYKGEQKIYTGLIEKGDGALVQKDYASASKAFADAAELKPYELYPKLKLAQIRKQLEQATVSANELFTQLINKAQIAENARKYELAKDYYGKAFSAKPEEAAKYADRLRGLNNRIRILSELGEKFVSGLYKEAINEYDAAIKKDNTNSDYYLGRAKCYDKLNDYSRALKDYTKSIDLDNNNLVALESRADLFRRNNEFFKALTDYKIYLTVEKTNLDIYSGMSDLHVLTGNTKAGMEDLDNALLVNPKSAMLYFKKGMLFLHQKDFNSSVENFTTTIHLDSNHVSGYYYRGEARLFSARVEQAASDFEKARVKGLDSERVRKIVNYAEEYYQKAQKLFFDKKLDSAGKLINYAILINERQAVYRFFRGELNFFAGDYREAIRNYDDAVILNKNYKDCLYKRGLSYFNLKDYNKAIENFDEVFRLAPNDYLAVKGLGDSYFFLANSKKAVDHIENCLKIIDAQHLKLEPGYVSAIYNTLGKCYIRLETYDKAISSLKSALKLDRNFAEAYFNKGYAYYMSGELGSSIEDLLKALSFESHMAWLNTLARTYRAKQDYANAIVYYRKSIEKDSLSEDPSAFYERGLCNFHLRNYTDALPDYLKSISVEIDTEYPAFNSELGTIYINTAKYDSAMLYFNKALLKDSGDVNALYGVASALYLQGKVDEALVAFERLFQMKGFSYGMVKRDKLLGKLRGEGRFKVLVKKYD